MNEEFNVKNSVDEDWTISKPNENLPPNQTIIEPIEDWGMTGKLHPPGQKADGWKMPEPQFRKSDGETPVHVNHPQQEVQDDESEITRELAPDFPAQAQSGFETANAAAPPPMIETAAVEPQPDISEVFVAAEIEMPPAPPKKQRSRGMRIFLIVFGIFAMFAFAVIFLTVVYFLFFYKTVVE